MKIINPATEAVITELKVDDASSVKIKYEKLQKGQKKWAALPVKDRLDTIVKFGDLVKQQADDLARILSSETGKPLAQAKGEVMGSLNRITHLKANAEKWLAPEVISSENGMEESIRYEALGVIANISAWNFPYNVGYNVFLYALVSGNAVLYKPSEFASLTGLKFQELLWEAGVPEDVFITAIGGGAVGEALLELPIDAYFFTGSYRTGKYIAEKLAEKLVPVQLELGGKDPLYVADDVSDVKEAAENAAIGAFYNNGQSCCAVERIYVHEKIYDEFLSAIVESVKNYKVGDPTAEDTFLGPLTRRPQLQVLRAQVEDAIKQGAKLECGGERIKQKGYFFEPTVLSDVSHQMELMQEESFGPIIGIQKVKSDEEALELMQDTDYGLTAAVFSKDKKRAEKLFEQLNTGTVYWNCCDRVSPNVPWSGRKKSGLGFTLSYLGIRAFVQPKAYHLKE
ncbi:MAG: aldehyde dehydrogenase family protein [Chitinophagales bacterium]